MLYRAMALCLAFVWASASSGSLRAEDRTIDGTNNNLLNPSQGAANTRLIRGFPNEYEEEYAGTNIGAMITEFTIPHRPNARDISNLVSAQTDSVLSARGLSDYLWIWGQFLDHDISLSTTSNGAVVNGSEPIPIHSVQDPLFPSGSVPFTRHNFVTGACVVGPPGCRQQINEVTSYIDGSGVYGTDNVRAAALRTAGGTGAQLRTSTDNLLPLNDGPVPFPNENNGPLPDNLLFLAGDIRANENVLLTSMHTLFVQEHNRLVDKISILQPGLLPEEQYQLARKIVGAEIQIITYNEFLPALIGPAAPNPANYSYDNTIDPTITQSFAHAAYRFGHSTVSPNLRRVSNDGASLGSLSLSNAFFDPTILSGDASQLDLLLKGAATQISQEVDTKVVDELRNMLFGPPGAGGMDLAAINIHRGRDHGLPDYNTLRFFL